MGAADQRVPITLTTVSALNEGAHTVEAVWKPPRLRYQLYRRGRDCGLNSDCISEHRVVRQPGEGMAMKGISVCSARWRWKERADGYLL